MLKTWIILCVAGLLKCYGAFAQSDAVHTMFLQQPVPADGITADFNPPVLRWPYTKGKQAKYDVRLSMDSTFSNASTIAGAGLRGAFFNPHQTLQPGKWYWQFRVADKPWSPPQSFTVGNKSLPMASPPPAKFFAGIRNAHPRILPAADVDLKHLATTPDAKVIIAAANNALNAKTLTEADARPAAKGSTKKQEDKILADAIVSLGNQMNQMVEPLCEAFLLTHDDRYLPKAVELAMEIASWDTDGVSGSRDFTDGICMYDMALVYDTFYDRLTPEQRNNLLKAVTKRAEKFYNSWINNIESKVLSGHVWQLLLDEFFKTSLALYGHEPEATKWLSYAYELFLARAPVLGGIDGGWAEGASYFKMNMEVLTYIPDKIKEYTGFDFIQRHPWYNNNAQWMIYNVPPGSSADGYGDNTEELFDTPPYYVAFADVMARLTQNSRYAWYAAKAQQIYKYDLSQENTLRWFRLTHAHLPVPAVADTLKFPMGQMNKEVGVAALHTNVANISQDLAVTFRSSPFGAYGHILADQNTFNILSGGKRLFFRTGYKVAMDDPHRLGWSKHTRGQNGVLINDNGQPYTADAYGNLSRFLQGEQLAYIKGDASQAYSSAETKEDYGVNKFYRHIVLLKPNIIVIYDELESAADANWSWLIHSLENMKVDVAGNTFTSTIANAKGVGKLWSSQPFAWQITSKFDVPAVSFRNYKGRKPKVYTDQWHLKATNKTKTSKLRFLSVIQVTADGSVLPFKETNTAAGVTNLSLGDWQITANLSYNLPPQLSITSVKRNTAFAAYGDDIKFREQVFSGTQNNSSKLVEWVNGKARFSELIDEPVWPIR